MKMLLLLTLIIPCATFAQQEKTYSRQLILMGCAFEISVVHNDSIYAEKCIDAAILEITRIENLLSEWKEDSQVSAVNKNAGMAPVKVDKEVVDLIKRSKKVSELTGGAFDISFASIYKLFEFDKKERPLPTDDEIKASVDKIGFENIILDEANSTVYLSQQGMKIGFGAIGKGYAAIKAKSVLEKMGIANGVVDASGDLLTWGKQPDGSAWKIGITDPDDQSRFLAWLDIDNTSIVTSGDYEKYFTCNGKRYAHIIDPKTGYPVSSLKSVTIITPNAELADALATAVFVLGEKEGLELIEQLNGIECIIVNAENKIITSKGLGLNFTQK